MKPCSKSKRSISSTSAKEDENCRGPHRRDKHTTKGMAQHSRSLSNIWERTAGHQEYIVSQFSIPGVILNGHLSWKEHVNMVTNTLSEISGVIHRLKYVFPKY